MDPKNNVEVTLDDMVFETRNKAYGAYDLRKTYKKTVNRSLLYGTVAFLAVGEAPVAQFQASYRYDETSVFGLPEISVGGTKLPAQVGATGTFFRQENYRLPGEPVFLTFFQPALN